MDRTNTTTDTTIAFVLNEPKLAAAELDRLRKIQAAALRVASSRRDGVVTDKGALDRLDAVLEGRE